MKEKTNLLGAPYFGMPCKIYELFRLVSFTENYGGYAYICITSTINTMVNNSDVVFLQKYKCIFFKF